MNESRKLIMESYHEMIAKASTMEPGSQEQKIAYQNAVMLYEQMIEEDKNKRDYLIRLMSLITQTGAFVGLSFLGFALEFGANGMYISDGMKNMMKELNKKH